MGPLTQEHRPRNNGAGRSSAGPSLTHTGQELPGSRIIY